MTIKNPNGKTRKKRHSRISGKLGKAPGTITYFGNRAGGSSHIQVLEYNKREFTVNTPNDVGECIVHKEAASTSWINIVGLSDEEFIAELGKAFHLNPLVLEDIVNTSQRPKIDEYDSYIFGVFRMLYLDEDQQLTGEHIALVLMENSVLVFQEVAEDVFMGVRERIKLKSGRVRSRGADYLFFALIDAIIDNYFVVLENINDRIDILEEEVYENPKPETAKKIQMLKKDVLKIRKWIFPVRDLVQRLKETEHPLITKNTKLFLRDALDHSTEINEDLHIYREMSMTLLEMYMSTVSNKMNEVMKVLTIMASIFIPLTFLAGIYGMNFENMPELQWKYSYFVLLGVMLLLFVLMLIYFRKKRWL